MHNVTSPRRLSSRIISGGYAGGNTTLGVFLLIVCMLPIYVILFVSIKPPAPPSQALEVVAVPSESKAAAQGKIVSYYDKAHVYDADTRVQVMISFMKGNI